MPITRGRRTFAAAASSFVLAGGLALAGVLPAHAADVIVIDTTQMAAALHNGTADRIVLGGSFSSVAISAAENDIIDLNGFLLTADTVTVEAGVHLTIQSSAAGGTLLADADDAGDAGIDTTLGTVSILSGTVTAWGAGGGAGIGGDLGADGGILNISGGTVTAKGDNGGAGIGGGRSSAGAGAKAGTITITGGTVNAIASWLLDPLAGGGAGIGGGLWEGPGAANTGGTIVIAGTAVVDATGTYSTGSATGAGIGGGANGNGGSISIGGAADVTAGALSNAAPAVGNGSNAAVFGTLAVDGTARLFMYGATYFPAITVTGTGTITGNLILNNYGSIQPTVDHTGGFVVNVNNFPVSFDPNYAGSPAPTVVPVYATTMTAGARAIPAPPVRPGYGFAGWNAAADGSGATFTTSTVLSAATTVYAQWTTPLVISGVSNIEAGTQTSFLVDQGGSDVTAGVTFTTDDSAAIIVGNQIEFRTAGTVEVTATLNSNTAVTSTKSVVVEPGPAASLTLASSATSVDQGGSITVDATGVDDYGNSLGDLSALISLSSDVATDVIDGNEVTFPHASPHTITATYGDASESFVVDVIPAAVAPASPGLASTGLDASGTVALVGLLLALGAALLMRHRVARTKP